MKVSPAHVVLGAVGLTVGVLGVGALREATLSTHHAMPTGSQLAVVVRAVTKGAEPHQTLSEMVEAQISTCRLEVESDLTAPISALDDDTFRAVLSPSMDETNRRQFRGCLEDFRVDHFRMDVLALGDVGSEDLVDDVDDIREDVDD